MKKNNYKYLRLLKTSFLFFIIYSCLFSKTKHNTIEVNRLTRDYYIYTPDKINVNTALIFILHGYSGSALGIMNYSGFNKFVNDHNFIACYPQGTKDDKGYAFWNVGYAFHPDQTVDDVQFVVKLVSKLKNNYNISDHNIFVTGMSNGGEMSYMLGCHTQGVFKAIASITGVMFNSFLNNCNPNPINAERATIVSITNSAVIILIIRIVELMRFNVGIITEPTTEPVLVMIPLIISLLFRDT